MINQQLRQQGKQIIDVGELGNPSTGDILFDGGEKINLNSRNMYLAFGDQRLMAQNTDVGNQVIHATGYFQKASQVALGPAIDVGTQWDIDTTAGSIAVTMPFKPQVGDCVKFINSNGSLSPTNRLELNAQTGGSFVGLDSVLSVSTPNVLIECWCVNTANGGIWNYAIKSMFGNSLTFVEKTVQLDTTKEIPITVGHVNEFISTKLMLSLVSTSNINLGRCSEINLFVTGDTTAVSKKLHHAEFAVIRAGVNEGDPDDLFTKRFDVDGDTVVMYVKAKQANLKLAVRTLSNQRLGSA